MPNALLPQLWSDADLGASEQKEDDPGQGRRTTLVICAVPGSIEDEVEIQRGIRELACSFDILDVCCVENRDPDTESPTGRVILVSSSVAADSGGDNMWWQCCGPACCFSVRKLQSTSL